MLFSSVSTDSRAQDIAVIWLLLKMVAHIVFVLNKEETSLSKLLIGQSICVKIILVHFETQVLFAV